METVTIALLVLIAVNISGIVSRILPFPLPRPLIQIALGAVLGLAADWRVTLDPELFFVLMLPPLLFLDGWRIPREELFKDGKTVVELAIGLVVFTVVGIGLFIHWLVPAMPLAVAFALAAVISPTDPVAISAIARGTSIPKRMMHILEGESLLNDASGLVCLRLAIAAALTGTFSAHQAAISFVWIALGGIAAGIGVTWTISRAKSWIARRYGEEGSAQILISLIIPFAAYLLAEYIHCSGILAAVAAGLTMGFVESSGELEGATRIRRNTVWDTIQFCVNGVIFVLLGEQLPAILGAATDTVRATGHVEIWWLGLYVLALNLGLGILRFLWVWVSFRLTLFRPDADKAPPPLRLVAAMSFAGARGAVTLAGVLTLPLTLTDGSPFPARDLAIILATGVIIVSLVAASIGLPLLLNGLEMPDGDEQRGAVEQARIRAAEAAIARIEMVQHELAEGRSDADLYVATAARIMDSYRHRIESRLGTEESAFRHRRIEEIERDLRLAALKAERAQIFQMVRKRELRSEPARSLIRELDLLEARYAMAH